jgi:hypothetical protein
MESPIMAHRPSQRLRSAPTTTRARQGTQTARKSASDGSQLIIIGAGVLGVGLVAAIGVAFAAGNDVHPVVRYLPWLPVVVGFVLLVYALSRVSIGRRQPRERSAPSDALEADEGVDGLAHGAR